MGMPVRRLMALFAVVALCAVSGMEDADTDTMQSLAPLDDAEISHAEAGIATAMAEGRDPALDNLYKDRLQVKKLPRGGSNVPGPAMLDAEQEANAGDTGVGASSKMSRSSKMKKKVRHHAKSERKKVAKQHHAGQLQGSERHTKVFKKKPNFAGLYDESKHKRTLFDKCWASAKHLASELGSKSEEKRLKSSAERMRKLKVKAGRWDQERKKKNDEVAAKADRVQKEKAKKERAVKKEKTDKETSSKNKVLAAKRAEAAKKAEAKARIAAERAKKKEEKDQKVVKEAAAKTKEAFLKKNEGAAKREESQQKAKEAILQAAKEKVEKKKAAEEEKRAKIETAKAMKLRAKEAAAAAKEEAELEKRNAKFAGQTVTKIKLACGAAISPLGQMCCSARAVSKNSAVGAYLQLGQHSSNVGAPCHFYRSKEARIKLVLQQFKSAYREKLKADRAKRRMTINYMRSKKMDYKNDVAAVKKNGAIKLQREKAAFAAIKSPSRLQQVKHDHALYLIKDQMNKHLERLEQKWDADKAFLNLTPEKRSQFLSKTGMEKATKKAKVTYEEQLVEQMTQQNLRRDSEVACSGISREPESLASTLPGDMTPRQGMQDQSMAMALCKNSGNVKKNQAFLMTRGLPSLRIRYLLWYGYRPPQTKTKAWLSRQIATADERSKGGCMLRRQFVACKGAQKVWALSMAPPNGAGVCMAMRRLLAKNKIACGPDRKLDDCVFQYVSSVKLCFTDRVKAKRLRIPVCTPKQAARKKAMWIKIRNARGMDRACAQMLGVTSKPVWKWKCIPRAKLLTGRLFSPSPWYATHNDMYQWLQIDTGGLAVVAGIAMQGNGGCAGVQKSVCHPQSAESVRLAPAMVQRYQVSSSTDGLNWQKLTGKPGQAREFGHSCTQYSQGSTNDAYCKGFMVLKRATDKIESMKTCVNKLSCVKDRAGFCRTRPVETHLCSGTSWTKAVSKDWRCPIGGAPAQSRSHWRHFWRRQLKAKDEDWKAAPINKRLGITSSTYDLFTRSKWVSVGGKYKQITFTYSSRPDKPRQAGTVMRWDYRKGRQYCIITYAKIVTSTGNKNKWNSKPWKEILGGAKTLKAAQREWRRAAIAFYKRKGWTCRKESRIGLLCSFRGSTVTTQMITPFETRKVPSLDSASGEKEVRVRSWKYRSLLRQGWTCGTPVDGKKLKCMLSVKYPKPGVYACVCKRSYAAGHLCGGNLKMPKKLRNDWKYAALGPQFAGATSYPFVVGKVPVSALQYEYQEYRKRPRAYKYAERNRKHDRKRSGEMGVKSGEKIRKYNRVMEARAAARRKRAADKIRKAKQETASKRAKKRAYEINQKVVRVTAAAKFTNKTHSLALNAKSADRKKTLLAWITAAVAWNNGATALDKRSGSKEHEALQKRAAAVVLAAKAKLKAFNELKAKKGNHVTAYHKEKHEKCKKDAGCERQEKRSKRQRLAYELARKSGEKVSKQRDARSFMANEKRRKQRRISMWRKHRRAVALRKQLAAIEEAKASSPPIDKAATARKIAGLQHRRKHSLNTFRRSGSDNVPHAPAASDARLQSLTSFTARYVRIHPTVWIGPVPSMRVELFGKAPCGSNCPVSAVGMAPRIVPASQVSATSAAKGNSDGSAGVLWDKGGWQSRPFYVCPDTNRGPQSMCSPVHGVVEWWRFLKNTRGYEDNKWITMASNIASTKRKCVSKLIEISGDTSSYCKNCASGTDSSHRELSAQRLSYQCRSCKGMISSTLWPRLRKKYPIKSPSLDSFFSHVQYPRVQCVKAMSGKYDAKLPKTGCWNSHYQKGVAGDDIQLHVLLPLAKAKERRSKENVQKYENGTRKREDEAIKAEYAYKEARCNRLGDQWKPSRTKLPRGKEIQGKRRYQIRYGCFYFQVKQYKSAIASKSYDASRKKAIDSKPRLNALGKKLEEIEAHLKAMDVKRRALVRQAREGKLPVWGSPGAWEQLSVGHFYRTRGQYTYETSIENKPTCSEVSWDGDLEKEMPSTGVFTKSNYKPPESGDLLARNIKLSAPPPCVSGSYYSSHRRRCPKPAVPQAWSPSFASFPPKDQHPPPYPHSSPYDKRCGWSTKKLRERGEKQCLNDNNWNGKGSRKYRTCKQEKDKHGNPNPYLRSSGYYKYKTLNSPDKAKDYWRPSLKLPKLCTRSKFKVLNWLLFNQLESGQVIMRMLRNPKRRGYDDGDKLQKETNFTIIKAPGRNEYKQCFENNLGQRECCVVGKYMCPPQDKSWPKPIRWKVKDLQRTTPEVNMNAPSFFPQRFPKGTPWYDTATESMSADNNVVGLCLKVSGLPVEPWQLKTKAEKRIKRSKELGMKKYDQDALKGSTSKVSTGGIDHAKGLRDKELGIKHKLTIARKKMERVEQRELEKSGLEENIERMKNSQANKEKLNMTVTTLDITRLRCAQKRLKRLSGHQNFTVAPVEQWSACGAPPPCYYDACKDPSKCKTISQRQKAIKLWCTVQYFNTIINRLQINFKEVPQEIHQMRMIEPGYPLCYYNACTGTKCKQSKSQMPDGKEKRACRDQYCPSAAKKAAEIKKSCTASEIAIIAKVQASVQKSGSAVDAKPYCEAACDIVEYTDLKNPTSWKEYSSRNEPDRFPVGMYKRGKEYTAERTRQISAYQERRLKVVRRKIRLRIERDTYADAMLMAKKSPNKNHYPTPAQVRHTFKVLAKRLTDLRTGKTRKAQNKRILAKGQRDWKKEENRWELAMKKGKEVLAKKAKRGSNYGDKEVLAGYERAQKKDAADVARIMEKHYRVMLRKDPEWQMIARHKMTTVVPKQEWASQFLQIDLCSRAESSSDAEATKKRQCAASRICGIAVQAHATSPSWVSHYKMSYSEGEWNTKTRAWQPSTWKFYTSKAGKESPGGTVMNRGDVLEGSNEYLRTISVGKKPETARGTSRSPAPTPPPARRLDLARWNAMENGKAWSSEIASIEIGTTMLQTPRSARFVRIHPVCWHGPSMSMRAELLSCASPFNWSFLRDRPTIDCGTIMRRARPSFLQWTDGKDASGVAFQTDGADINVRGNSTYLFRAYQKRVIRGKGLLIKQLICFDRKMESKDAQAGRPKKAQVGGRKCCVAKVTRSIKGQWQNQVLETQLF